MAGPKTPVDYTTSGHPGDTGPAIATQASGPHDSVESPLGLDHKIFYFSSDSDSNIDSGDTWASPFAGRIRAWGWSGETTGNTYVACDPATGIFTFTNSAVNQTGWLHVWVKG
jgi:hypothetical protein